MSHRLGVFIGHLAFLSGFFYNNVWLLIAGTVLVLTETYSWSKESKENEDV